MRQIDQPNSASRQPEKDDMCSLIETVDTRKQKKKGKRKNPKPYSIALRLEGIRPSLFLIQKTHILT